MSSRRREAPIPPRWIAVASEPIVDVDTTAADMLDELIGELGARAWRCISRS